MARLVYGNTELSILPQDAFRMKITASTFGRRWLPSSIVWITRMSRPHTARMSASTEFDAASDGQSTRADVRCGFRDGVIDTGYR